MKKKKKSTFNIVHKSHRLLMLYHYFLDTIYMMEGREKFIQVFRVSKCPF